jgi:D-alanyl-D-alanine carboxypeptidase (penicillin-binding protein 5/6)
MGQTTTVAENLREPAPIGDVVRPPTEQGSGDQASVRIVLTDPSNGRHVIMPDTPEGAYAPSLDRGGPPSRAEERRLAKAEVTRPGARGHDDDSWAVQIGAYRSKSEARAELSALEDRFSGRLADADHNVEAAGRGYYRARFSGLSEAEAKRACTAMRAHRQTCVVVAPDV